MNENPVLELRKMLRGSTQKNVADMLGISPQYLCDVVQGRREPGPKILDALHLERLVIYRRKN